MMKMQEKSLLAKRVFVLRISSYSTGTSSRRIRTSHKNFNPELSRVYLSSSKSLSSREGCETDGLEEKRFLSISVDSVARHAMMKTHTFSEGTAEGSLKRKRREDSSS